jgi:C-terminal processing protease CtpA/Prc
MDSQATMIIIRSLVPGGVAQMDGRLEPGDRLVSVNGINVYNSSLETAVQALTGAPRGVVRITVFKPEKFGESSTDNDQVCRSLDNQNYSVERPRDDASH